LTAHYTGVNILIMVTRTPADMRVMLKQKLTILKSQNTKCIEARRILILTENAAAKTRAAISELREKLIDLDP